jgi:hypothetical protein
VGYRHGPETLLPTATFVLDLDPEPSPDGGWIKRFLKGNIEIRPMAGGDWKPLIPLRAASQSRVLTRWEMDLLP